MDPTFFYCHPPHCEVWVTATWSSWDLFVAVTLSLVVAVAAALILLTGTKQGGK